MAETLVTIEVAYATPGVQALVTLVMPEGSTLQQAVEASGILQRFTEIDLAVNQVGILGQICNVQQVLQDTDRVEIYRPLLRDPKDARRNRALKK
ncbi:MAG: RnfH family protein [Methylococcales bacterium]